jgi:hypothetical protein
VGNCRATGVTTSADMALPSSSKEGRLCSFSYSDHFVESGERAEKVTLAELLSVGKKMPDGVELCALGGQICMVGQGDFTFWDVLVATEECFSAGEWKKRADAVARLLGMPVGDLHGEMHVARDKRSEQDLLERFREKEDPRHHSAPLVRIGDVRSVEDLARRHWEKCAREAQQTAMDGAQGVAGQRGRLRRQLTRAENQLRSQDTEEVAEVDM